MFNYTFVWLKLNSTTRTRPDPTEFRRKKSPCGSGRVRVVEFSYWNIDCDSLVLTAQGVALIGSIYECEYVWLLRVLTAYLAGVLSTAS